jgi:hypothetical protein
VVEARRVTKSKKWSSEENDKAAMKQSQLVVLVVATERMRRWRDKIGDEGE